MKTLKNLVATLLLGGLTSASVTRADEPAHLDAAITLLEQITLCQANGIYSDTNGVSLNRYGGSWNSSSNPSFIRFADPVNGILPANNTKCSPLVTHLLKNIYNLDWRNYSFYDPILATTKSVASPTPYQYIQLIKEGKGLAHVPTLNAALPGDILSWWQVGTDSSDHTMIIAEINWSSAKVYPGGYANSNPALVGKVFVEVRVIDSSADLHTADSRLVNVNGTVQHIPGLGTGIIGLLINSNSEIIGRTWSLPTSNFDTQKNSWIGGLNSRLKLAPSWEMVIGRVP